MHIVIELSDELERQLSKQTNIQQFVEEAVKKFLLEEQQK